MQKHQSKKSLWSGPLLVLERIPRHVKNLIAWGSLDCMLSLTPAARLCNNAISDSLARKFSAASDSKHTQMKQPQMAHQHPSFHFESKVISFQMMAARPGRQEKHVQRPWNKT